MSEAIDQARSAPVIPTTQTPGNDSWPRLKELTLHVFVGVGVFILLAIPAIALDFFNQGIELLDIQRSSNAATQPPTQASPNDGTSNLGNQHTAHIKVSPPVRITLHAIEYFILGVDSVFVIGFLANGLWTFVRSLKWK